jgi:class 3 adenylate cyclase/predicted ATPase
LISRGKSRIQRVHKAEFSRARAAMQEIADWLEKLGMSEYALRFAENDIDASVLPHLTDQSLKELSVSLGHRLKILAAVRELGGSTSAVAEPAVAPEPKPKDTAERRQVTVMFSDLVGSTALSARTDPEDLREVISAYQKCVAESVRRFGGFVAKYMGDGVLVYFGYPQAHEDDAERAVRAGLELIGAVSEIKPNVPLQTRVGIATGLVIVGDLIGAGQAQEHGIVGETPNLAARLQGIAEPNTVVIAESTRKLLGNLFELQDLGAKEVKGVAGSVQTWAAVRARSVEGRFEALHTTGLTGLVGREEELELLLRRWSRAKTGEGQVVLLSGEAGIGKSRLSAALMERVVGEPHTRLRYFCSAQHTDSALHPVIGQMERAAEFAHGDTLQVKLDKLDALLAQTSTSIQDASLFADMLSLPNDGRYPALNMTSEHRRQRTLEALVSQVEALSCSTPVLMIFEDAHWTDPTSLEALSRIVDRLRTCRVLLIVTFRPEFNPPWIGRPHVTAVTLNRLAQRDIEAVIDHVVGNKLISVSIRQDIIERTDGIPLFVEEMTKAVLEAGSEGEAQFIPSPAIAVPASLQASLMARLDRLGSSAKEVAQIGAAIGREFSHALLSAVVTKPERELASALERLIATGLVFRQGVPPQASYLFKHALVQDAAYSTLLREPRRALHARIAETLESQFTEITENQPELLARHCAEAGLTEKAAWLWGKAGEGSLARSAVVEASEQLKRALDQIATLPQTSVLRRQQLKLQIALANALIGVGSVGGALETLGRAGQYAGYSVGQSVGSLPSAVTGILAAATTANPFVGLAVGAFGQLKGYAAPEPKAAFEQVRLLMERAEALGEAPEDPLLLFSFLWGVWSGNYVKFNGEAIKSLASQVMALAERQGTTTPLMVGHRLVGMSALHTGDIDGSRQHFDRAIALYDPAEHRTLAPRFGQDIRVAALSFRARALWLLGYPALALADVESALKDGREIDHGPSLMYALYNAAELNIYCGYYAAASKHADEVVIFATQKGVGFWKAFGIIHQSMASALLGNASDGVQKIASAINAYRSMGSTLNLPEYLGHLANAHTQLGQIDDAWRCIGEAMTIMEASGEIWYEAELHRVAGEIALNSPDQDAAKAVAHFERAIAVARAQQAKSWELRAAMSMARLWRDQGKRTDARDLLAPVYGWFSEGFDTLDLKEAKALLEELAA